MSRTFGDIEAKKNKYGGNPKVIIAEPEIKSFKILPKYDFVLLACKIYLVNILIGDGVFDKLDSAAVISIAWDSAKKNYK